MNEQRKDKRTKRKTREKKNSESETTRSNESKDVGRSSGRRETCEKKDCGKSCEKSCTKKDNGKSDESVFSLSEKPDETSGKERKGKQTKRQNPELKTNDSAGRKKQNKTKGKTSVVGGRTRVRSAEEHNEAIRFLRKRIYFAKTQEKANQYKRMIKKLKETTEII